MAAIKIQVEKRTGLGKNRVDKMREENFVPGVLYGKGEETEHVKVDRREFERVYKSAGMSTLVDLELDGAVTPVLIKDVQIHPFKNQYLHVDFLKLNMNETVKLTVPIILNGRDNITIQPSILVQQLDEIEVECLPGNIPQAAEVDVTDIDFTTPIFVSDLDIFKDEDITILREGEDVIASLVEPAEEEELEEDAEETLEADDVPVIGEEEDSEE